MNQRSAYSGGSNCSVVLAPGQRSKTSEWRLASSAGARFDGSRENSNYGQDIGIKRGPRKERTKPSQPCLGSTPLNTTTTINTNTNTTINTNSDTIS